MTPHAPPSLLLLASFLAAADADRHKQIVAANEHCTLKCLNGGYCSPIKYTDYPQKGDVGYYQGCVCRPGYTGGACEKVAEQCQPPQYQCHNGAPCERQADGTLGCDCAAADAVSELAGYMCRHPSMETCATLDETNRSFCTNGGVCLSSATAVSKHLMFPEPTVHKGCKCDDAFKGPHCEFIRGMPISSLVEVPSSEKGAGAKAGITLSLFAVAALLVGVLVVRRRRRQLRPGVEPSWNAGEERFRTFYQDEVVSDGSLVVDDEDEDDEGEEEGDLQLRMETVGYGEGGKSNSGVV